MGKLKTGLNALRQLEEVRGVYEELLNEKDLKSKSVEAQKRRVMEHERQLGGIKEEFAEKVFGWAETHSILEIGKPILSQVVERAYQYGTPYRFDEILEPARTAYERIREEHNSEKSRFHGEKAVLQKSFDEKLTALNALKAQKEPEPERTSAVLINRQRLKGANIPFVPLYKALDFNKDLNDSLKGILEEGLQDMGILDALIIDPKYQKAVLDMDAGMADKYLFADPQVLSHNLSTYLKPETADVHVETLIVEDIIRSLILNPSESGSYITETGHYGMGIVTGKVSGTSESRFIGYQSRKRYKEQLIDLAMAEMDSVQNQIDAIQKQIDEYESKLLACQKAWALFPGKSDLDEAFYDLQKEQRELNALSVELERIGIRADQHYGKLKTQQLEVHERTQGIHLPHRSTEYQEAIEDMEAYKSMLHALILEDTKQLHLIDMLSSLEERLESHAEIIDNLRYDLNRIHRETGVIKDRIMHVTRELELSDYQAVLNDIEQCRARLEKIPEQMQIHMNELAQKESGIQTKHSDLENNQKQLEKSNQMSAVYQWAFTEEWKLGYSELEKIDGSVLEQAQNVLTAYGVALEEGKTIVDLHQSLRNRELTNNAFFTFSGGEKAMAMYVPLFSAVYAKYQGGNADCPKVISLDEAFAGVDEKNIEDMFRLLLLPVRVSLTPILPDIF